MILRALFGSDTLRFAAMLGSFTFIYKLCLNALPLIPLPNRLVAFRSRRERNDLEANVATPDEGSTGQQTPLTVLSNKYSPLNQENKRGHLSLHSEIVYSRLEGARWHAVLAGGLAGLSLLWEKKSRRITIAQQSFVRSAPKIVPAVVLLLTFYAGSEVSKEYGTLGAHDLESKSLLDP